MGSEMCIRDSDYSDQISMDELNLEDTKDALWNLVELGAVLAQKYDVVCTNPPYMGIANLGGMLYDYIQAQFDAFKQDLYCVFVEKCRKLLKKNGIQSLITQQSFMFNSRFENMREALINASAFVNMIYLGTKAFDEISGEKVRTCAYVIQNIRLPEYISYYIDLQEQESELSKEQAFLSIANVRNVSNCNRYTAKLINESALPRIKRTKSKEKRYAIFRNCPRASGSQRGRTRPIQGSKKAI